MMNQAIIFSLNIFYTSKFSENILHIFCFLHKLLNTIAHRMDFKTNTGERGISQSHRSTLNLYPNIVEQGIKSSEFFIF